MQLLAALAQFPFGCFGEIIKLKKALGLATEIAEALAVAHLTGHRSHHRG